MALKGSFNWYNSINQGGKKAISFTLTCNNLYQSESFDCAIIDGSGQVSPQIRRQITLKAKQSFRFDYDTCGWDWCNGDFFAILGKNDIIQQRWDLNLNIFEPGECPDCHGTYRCKMCNGTGLADNVYSRTYTQCKACLGTGICQTCYVPIRKGSNLDFQINGGVQMPNPEKSRQRRIEALRQTIKELEMKIEREEWNMRMWQRREMDVSMPMTYDSFITLKHTYQRQLIQVQHELQQLENMDKDI